MSAKHTLGPLTVEDRIERLVIWSSVEGRPEIASLSTDSGEVEDADQRAFELEQAAYAHLFAAAPELLEAAREALEQMEFSGDGHSRGAEAIRAAIAKATGGAA